MNSQSMMGLGGDDDKMENGGGGGGGGGGFFESFKVSDVPPLDVAAALMLCMYDDWRSCPDACLSCFCFCLFVFNPLWLGFWVLIQKKKEIQSAENWWHSV